MSDPPDKHGRAPGDMTPRERAEFEGRLSDLGDRLGRVKAHRDAGAEADRDAEMRGRGMGFTGPLPQTKERFLTESAGRAGLFWLPCSRQVSHCQVGPSWILAAVVVGHLPRSPKRVTPASGSILTSVG